MSRHRASARRAPLIGAVLMIASGTGLGIVIVFHPVEVAGFSRALVCAVAHVQGGSCG